jgi:hypothetical protein
MPIIIFTQEAEIRKSTVQSQPEQRALKTLSKIPQNTKNRDGGVIQAVEALTSNCSTTNNTKKKGSKLICKSFLIFCPYILFIDYLCILPLSHVPHILLFLLSTGCTSYYILYVS